MSAVPAAALERYRRLVGMAEDARAAALASHDVDLHCREDSQRLERELTLRGTRLQVDDNGCPFWIEQRLDDLAQKQHGPYARSASVVSLRHYVTDEPVLVERAHEIMRLRRQAAEAAARRERHGRRAAALRQLADACGAELARRGWCEGPARVTGVAGVAA
jgi:hypothetical protein